MSNKITNMKQIRDYAIETMEALRNGSIEIHEALAVGKLIDTTINTVKMQLEYNKVVGDNSPIEFMSNGNLIEGKAQKILGHDK